MIYDFDSDSDSSIGFKSLPYLNFWPNQFLSKVGRFPRSALPASFWLCVNCFSQEVRCLTLHFTNRGFLILVAIGLMGFPFNVMPSLTLCDLLGSLHLSYLLYFVPFVAIGGPSFSLIPLPPNSGVTPFTSPRLLGFGIWDFSSTRSGDWINMSEIQKWTVNEVRLFRILCCTRPGFGCGFFLLVEGFCRSRCDELSGPTRHFNEKKRKEKGKKGKDREKEKEKRKEKRINSKPSAPIRNLLQWPRC